MIDRRHEAIEIQATPDEVYDLVAAIDRVPDFSPETRRIEWIGDLHEPVVGARFRGRNRWRGFTWWREVHITSAARGRTFAFETVPGRGIYHDSTSWRYDLEPTPTGTRVTVLMRRRWQGDGHEPDPLALGAVASFRGDSDDLHRAPTLRHRVGEHRPLSWAVPRLGM